MVVESSSVGNSINIMKKKEKEPKKTYIANKELDNDVINFLIFGFRTLNLQTCMYMFDDSFINMLCDDNIFRGIEWYTKDDGEADINEPEDQGHFEDEDRLKVSVEYMVHDPTVKGNKIEPYIGRL